MVILSNYRKVNASLLGWAHAKRKEYDISDEEPVDGKIVIITGANSGIGKMAALEMAKRGAIVVIACPGTERELSQSVMEEIKNKTNNSKVEIVDLDLGDLSSIRQCAQLIHEKYSHINILINNAGVMYGVDKKRRVTQDEFEIHMGINHLGHVLFTMLLLDLVKKGAPSRIVSTASLAFQVAEIDLNDLMLEKRGVFGWQNVGPYGNSKLAVMYFISALAKELRGTGVTTYSLCPGFVNNTGIFRNITGITRLLKTATFMLVPAIKTCPEKAAEMILHCALSKTRAQESGQMYRLNNKWPKAQKMIDDNPEVEQKLWDMSLNVVGFEKP